MIDFRFMNERQIAAAVALNCSRFRLAQLTSRYWVKPNPASFWDSPELAGQDVKFIEWAKEQT